MSLMDSCWACGRGQAGGLQVDAHQREAQRPRHGVLAARVVGRVGRLGQQVLEVRDVRQVQRLQVAHLPELADHPVRQDHQVPAGVLAGGQLLVDLGEEVVVGVDVLGVVDRDPGLGLEGVQRRPLVLVVRVDVDVGDPVREVDDLLGVGLVRARLALGGGRGRPRARARTRAGRAGGGRLGLRRARAEQARRAHTEAGGQEAAARGASRHLAPEGIRETVGGVEELVAGPGYVVHAMVRPITCGAEQRAVGAMSVPEPGNLCPGPGTWVRARRWSGARACGPPR